MYRPSKAVITDCSKAKKILEWNPSPFEQAIQVTTQFFEGAFYFVEELGMMNMEFSMVYDYYSSLQAIKDGTYESQELEEGDIEGKAEKQGQEQEQAENTNEEIKNL